MHFSSRESKQKAELASGLGGGGGLQMKIIKT